MKLFQKSVSFLLALVLIFSCAPLSFAEETKKADTAETAETDVIEIETETNKSKYRTTSTAKITITVTNTGDKPLYNVQAQTFFDDLIPVNKKSSTTSKRIECLQPGDNFSFSYKAILNADKFNVNLFSKLALIFIKFFKGSYLAKTNDNTGKDISVKKQTEEIIFGKCKAENLVEVTYSTKEKETAEKETTTKADAENKKNDNNQLSIETTTQAPETTTERETTTTYKEPETTEYRTTEYRTTERRTTEPRTTRPTTTRPTTTRPTTTRPTTTERQPDMNDPEVRAYSAFIEFLQDNRSYIDQCDAADINGDGIYDLIIESYQGVGVVYTYNDQYGVYELYSQSRGKGYEEMYYSVLNQLVIFPSADTGGETYTTVRFSSYDISITEEIVYNNGKFDTGCFRNGVEISKSEYESIVDSYANQYYNVDGSPSQLISVLQGLI